MAEVLMCDCGRHEVDEFEVRVLHDGVHAVNGCDVQED